MTEEKGMEMNKKISAAILGATDAVWMALSFPTHPDYYDFKEWLFARVDEKPERLVANFRMGVDEWTMAVSPEMAQLIRLKTGNAFLVNGGKEIVYVLDDKHAQEAMQTEWGGLK